MAARKTASARKPAKKRAPPRKKAAPKKKVSARKKAAPRATGAKPAKAPPKKRAPAKPKPGPLGVVEALEAFLAAAELTGEASVRAEIARELAAKLVNAEPQTAPALSRELREAMAGIMPKDSEEHDDWSTRTAGAGPAANRDPA